MNKNLRKAMYTRSRLRNKFYQILLKENEFLYKKQRNKCVYLRKISMKKYFNDTTKHGVTTNKIIWNIIMLCLSSKGRFNHQDNMICNSKKTITN